MIDAVQRQDARRASVEARRGVRPNGRPSEAFERGDQLPACKPAVVGCPPTVAWDDDPAAPTDTYQTSRLGRDPEAPGISVAPSPLIGREDDLRIVAEMLRQPAVRMLTLVGPAGVGKTRLAMAAAEIVQQSFAHGIAWVDLAPLPESQLVLPTISRVLGIRRAAAPSQLEALAEHLRTREVLLVLDNFEQVMDAAIEVAEVVGRCAGLKVLVTSREPLRVRWEQVVVVPPLRLPDVEHSKGEDFLRAPAIALFVSRARTCDPAFTVTGRQAHALKELCARLDGLPLAIELAALRVRAIPPDVLLARLDRRLDLLRGPRDAPARHQTLRAAISWSHDLLTTDQQILFRRLSVFSSGCTLDAAEAICGDDGSLGVLIGIAELVDKGLLVHETARGESRYAMLETIREYAAEQLDNSDEAFAMRSRHADYILALAEEAERHLTGSNQRSWLNRLAREHGNIQQALRWYATHGEIERGLRLATVLWRYWYVRGHIAEGAHWLDTLLACPTSVGHATRAKALRTAGNLAQLRGQPVSAMTLHKESLQLWRTLGQLREVAVSLNSLGNAAMACGDLRGAETAYLESLEIRRALGDKRGMASTQHNLANMARESGCLQRAEVLATESMKLFREAGDEHGVVSEFVNLGEVAWDGKDSERAVALWIEGLCLAHRLASQPEIEMSVRRLAEARAQQGLTTLATSLMAASEMLRDCIGTLLRPTEQSRYEDVLAALRRSMTSDAFEKAWSAGRTLSLEQAVEAALDDRDNPSASTAASPEESLLTPREREVAIRVAEGLTNPEIAKALVLSEKTVGTHLEHIFRKLQIRTRTKLAMWARDHLARDLAAS